MTLIVKTAIKIDKTFLQRAREDQTALKTHEIL